jgi:hypothetical protein
MKKLLLTLVFALVFIALHAQIEWRNNRTGIYPDEKGLLKTWPEKGPAMLQLSEGGRKAGYNYNPSSLVSHSLK